MLPLVSHDDIIHNALNPLILRNLHVDHVCGGGSSRNIKGYFCFYFIFKRRLAEIVNCSA